MCGIAGVVSFQNNQTISNDKLKAMVDTLYHRGPDEAGMAIHGNAALGMRRLSIIDLSGGSQPIYNEDKSIWTVFNGEIYNFPDLKKELTDKGHIFKTNSDTEVIVHGYEEWGIDFPKKLNGMFAIALHDQKKNKFVLVRDHVGIKPVYYSFSNKRIVFGSEIKAILETNLVDKELDMNALGEFLSWEYIPGESTLIKSISKLEPGKLLEIDISNPKCNPYEYWDVPFYSNSPSTLSEAEWIEKIDWQIQKSTKMQMISDVPLGAFLSGGVDSSLIAASMGSVKTFSIGFDDPTYNELTWARKVADQLGVDHKDEIIKPDVLDLFNHLMQFMDDPIGDFSIFPTYLVSRLARQHVTVSLSGDGGDELFGGYETYLANHKANQFQKIPSFLRKGMIEPIINSINPTAKKKGLINKSKRFVEGLQYENELSHARWRLFVGDAVKQNLFTQDAYGNLTVNSADHIVKLFDKAGDRGELNRSLYVDVKSYLVDNILTKVDRMSMAVSLEARVPYLDPDVVDLAFQVPESLKTDANTTKIILKKVAAKHVPSECIYRPKEGFSIPIKNWLNNEFKPLMNDLLDEQKIKSDGIFNSTMIKNLKSEHQAGTANHSHILWALIVFHDWKNRWLS
ncbi:MAG: asparagine synthase (glutamine-hydrolyzing) [Ignavibacteriae bacterium]|nr:asparagine synthase (glutamine-hydrolyzing) [Ignavibacteriota bacterium]MCB9207943.1 asparagine synthase (glutamine-hydrolyzing) [Ignavibacteriales bacterium]MCB9258712.1 asparagine synthase (glutamine-hydrolyzing) [Ignavibacteriales bacterium]